MPRFYLTTPLKSVTYVLNLLCIRCPEPAPGRQPSCGGSPIGCKKTIPGNEHATRVPPQAPSRAVASDRGYNAPISVF